jgi:hypothetical protein
MRYLRSDLLLQSKKSSAGNGSGKRERERGGEWEVVNEWLGGIGVHHIQAKDV